jgi:hypothetical protein
MNSKRILFLKSHIGSYTRSDGTFVQAHDDKRAKSGLHEELSQRHNSASANGIHAMIAHDVPSGRHRPVFTHQDGSKKMGPLFDKRDAAVDHAAKYLETGGKHGREFVGRKFKFDSQLKLANGDWEVYNQNEDTLFLRPLKGKGKPIALPISTVTAAAKSGTAKEI